jgi:hypothetical protein
VTDWKAVAKARGLGIPDQDLERTVAPLTALEETFRQLAQQLRPEDEPAALFDPAEFGE